MADRQLFLLSPYRLPTHHQVTLNDDEMNAWMHGFVCLWHPALLRGCQQPPRVDSPYEHEFPAENQVFLIPQSPPLFQPDDWQERVRLAGALHFRASPQREDTLFHLRQMIEEGTKPDSEPRAVQHFGDDETKRLLLLGEDVLEPFFGLGFGYLMIESLFDAMDHEHLLDVSGFMADLRSAIDILLQPEPGAWRAPLKDAASKLLSAREVLYSVGIHLLDVHLMEEKTVAAALPRSLDEGVPLNLIANGLTLEKLRAEHPEVAAKLREKLLSDAHPPVLELCGGVYREREDALLPVESQLWNFRAGKRAARECVGAEVSVYARKRSAFSPQTPLWLYHTGFKNALMLNFDNAVLPNHRATLVNWPSPDGKAVDAFTRMPLPADQAQTYFNLVYNLQQSIGQDSAPTLSILHRGEPASPLYRDWLALSKLAPVLGQWTTFSRYFSDAMAGEYTGPANADDFFADYLEERINLSRCDPVTGFARQSRLRRRIDNAFALAALFRMLNTNPPTDEDRESVRKLRDLEDHFETEGLDAVPAGDGSFPETEKHQELNHLEGRWMRSLAEKLQVRAPENVPGYLLVNTCSFPRRVVLELEKFGGPIPIEGPVKAGQFDGDTARLVVEISALGFAWIPKGNSRTSAPRNRIRTADGNVVRNEFLEAEVDPVTGGLKGIRDSKTLAGRLGQQLVYNPGSRMEARKIQVTSSGTALGEIVSEGVLLNDQNEELATFRQRFRAWVSRPVLDLRIEIEPKHQPTGYPWHSYYGSRFAWRDERTALFRGVNGTGVRTNHTRPQTSDYLELRLGKSNVAIFPGGLPFHQKQGSRMLDVVLIPESEKGRVFDLALAMDRENLTQTATGFITPTPIIETTKGAPHIGPTGWLFHLDAPNLLLTSLRPYEQAGGAARSVVAQFLETTTYGGRADFQSVRDPVKAVMLDGSGVGLVDLTTTGDAVGIDFSGGDLVRVRIDYD